MSNVPGNVPGYGPTILVVDDDDDIRLMTSECLRKEGYFVIEAGDGLEAEQIALEYVPQLILLDVNMPGTDGLSALWNLREYSQLVNVPVIIVSAHDAFDLRAEAAAAGCKDYLIKPLAVDDIRQVVRSIFEGQA